MTAILDLTKAIQTYRHFQQTSMAGPIRTVSAVFNGADAASVKGSAIGVNDVAQLVNVPAGAFVQNVTHQVTTPEGATSTYSIGDGSGPAGYVSAANGNTATFAGSFNGTTTPTFGVGKFYAVADTIDLLLASGTAANLVVSISVTYIDTMPS